MRALRQALIDELGRLGPHAFTAELERLVGDYSGITGKAEKAL